MSRIVSCFTNSYGAAGVRSRSNESERRASTISSWPCGVTTSVDW